jgi:hypothetical protein
MKAEELLFNKISSAVAWRREKLQKKADIGEAVGNWWDRTKQGAGAVANYAGSFGKDLKTQLGHAKMDLTSGISQIPGNLMKSTGREMKNYSGDLKNNSFLASNKPDNMLSNALSKGTNMVGSGLQTAGTGLNNFMKPKTLNADVAPTESGVSGGAH